MELRLKEILKERKITISAFSELVGITQANMSNIINGKNSPTLDTLTRINKALGIHIAELFREEEDIEIYVKYKGQLHPLTKADIIKVITNNENEKHNL